MHRKLVVLGCLLGCLLGALLRGPAWAEGYLATDLHKLPDLVFGVDQTGFAVSTPSYRLTTGKAYQLTIVSTGKREYAIHADEFFNFIWLRKVEVGDVEIKATGPLRDRDGTRGQGNALLRTHQARQVPHLCQGPG